MNGGCDLLLVFNAREKLREKNSVINQLRNQLSLLEETLREKCDEIIVLHEQLYALSNRVDYLSSKRTQTITRFTTSRDNYSTTRPENDDYSSLDSLNKLEGINNNATTTVNQKRLFRQLECIQLLTAESPLTANSSATNTTTSCKKPSYILPKTFTYEEPVRRKSKGIKYNEFSLNDIFTNAKLTNDKISNDRFGHFRDGYDHPVISNYSTSATSSDFRPRTYSAIAHCLVDEGDDEVIAEDVNLRNDIVEDVNIDLGDGVRNNVDINVSGYDSVSVDVGVGVELSNTACDSFADLIKKRASSKDTYASPPIRHGHMKTNSLTIINKNDSQLVCGDNKSAEFDYQDIKENVTNKLVFYMNNNKRVNKQLIDTFSNIKFHQHHNITEPLDTSLLGVHQENSQLSNKSLLFIKYTFQNELLHMNEEFVMYLNQLIHKLQNFDNK